MDTPVPPADTAKSAAPTIKTVTVTVNKSAQPPLDINETRLRLFRDQEQAVQHYYTSATSNLLFYIASKKSQYVEYHRLQLASYLNARDNVDLQQLQMLFDNLHVIDDLLMSIVTTMPAQRPVGWQLASQAQNLLNLATTHPTRTPDDVRGLESSVAATVLQFFGVGCYSMDRGYFVGHILGYLFCCYYFAHLGINYAVTPLKEKIAQDYAYQWVAVPELVRLLQTVSEAQKTQVYQLAVYCAQISEYAVDKRIERMLITEVNSFNKQQLRDELSEHLLYPQLEKAALFQPIKTLK